MIRVAQPPVRKLDEKPATLRTGRVTATVVRQPRPRRNSGDKPASVSPLTQKKTTNPPVAKQPVTKKPSPSNNKARPWGKPTKAQLSTANTTSGVAPSIQRTSRRPPAPGQTPASPSTHLKKQLDQLTLKNEESLRRIAQQNIELKQLRSAVSSSNRQSQQNRKMTQIEDQLHLKEKEVEKLKQQLKKKTATSSEKERALLEREVSLKKEMQTYKKQQSRLQDLESNARKHKELLKKLTEKEKEIDALRNKAAEKLGNKTKQTIDNLTQQLESQKKNHEESLRLHQTMLKDLEKSLSEHAASTEKLRQAHQDEIRELQNVHSTKLLAWKAKHNEELAELRQRLETANEAQKSNTDANTDEQLEQILYEFEQSSHNHPVNLAADKESKAQVHSGLVPQVQTQHHQLGWMARYLPTEAISWPAPQPLSILKKTEWLHPKDGLPKHSDDEDVDHYDDSDSDDSGESVFPPDKVHLYVSNVCSNAMIRKKQEHLKNLLAANHVPFDLVDVASSKTIRQGRTKETPQMFVGGEFRGHYNDVVRAVDDGTLDMLLKPASHRVKVLDPPTTIDLGSVSEDDMLLQELEKEFKQGNITLADLDI